MTWDSLYQVGFISSVALNFDPFDFLEREFLAGAIVEFGGTWWFEIWTKEQGTGVISPANWLDLSLIL